MFCLCSVWFQELYTHLHLELPHCLVCIHIIYFNRDTRFRGKSRGELIEARRVPKLSKI